MHILMFDIQIKIAPVSQLDREVGFYPNGCGFESCRGRQFLVRVLNFDTIRYRIDTLKISTRNLSQSYRLYVKV
jgi:hypothetical protein